MKTPGILEGAVLALPLSLAGGLALAALGALLPGALAFRLTIAGLGLAYLLYLLGRSRERTGRLVTVTAWLAMAAAAWAWPLSPAEYLLAHLGGLWLARSLYFHGGIAAALADLLLNGLALLAGLWAFRHTGGAFAGFWCFFLVQALFPAIPGAGGANADAPPPDRFQEAHRAAEAALRRLSIPR